MKSRTKKKGRNAKKILNDLKVSFKKKRKRRSEKKVNKEIQELEKTELEDIEKEAEGRKI